MENYYLFTILFTLPGAIIAITLHEFVRALVSTTLGDTLPKDEGRLTLNPMSHFEPVGFILLIYTGGFGWGKPVRTAAFNYKNRKRDSLLVAIIPTIANFLLAYLLYQSLFYISNGMLWWIVQLSMLTNLNLAIYNLIPISPMDGSKVLAACLSPNSYMRFLHNEKIMQLVFLLLLFSGYVQRFIQEIAAVILSIF